MTPLIAHQIERVAAAGMFPLLFFYTSRAKLQASNKTLNLQGLADNYKYIDHQITTKQHRMGSG